MKRLLSLSLFLMTALLSFAHSFEVDGIYYSITSSTAPYTVAVTYQGTSYSEYNNEYTGSVTIPEKVTYNGKTYSVTSISDYAFYGCTNITSIDIPSTVTSIGSQTFRNCGSFEVKFIFRCPVPSIAQDAFINIGMQGEQAYIYVYEEYKEQYEEVIGNLKSCRLQLYTLPKVIDPVVLDGVKYYFKNNHYEVGNSKVGSGYSGGTSINIRSVIYSNESNRNQSYPVTVISYQAFGGCSEITSVNIPNSVTTIGSSAFDGCSSLTSITIPNSVTQIEYGMFQNCSGLTSVTIPNSVTSIGSYAFNGCSSLTSVTIGNSVTSIISNAFSGCSNLSSVEINSDVIVSKNYSSSSSIKNIFGTQVQKYVIGNDVTSIGKYAFYGCDGLTSVTIGNSVKSIGGKAFSGCNSLKKVIVPDIAAWCNISFIDSFENPLYNAKHIYSDENTEITNLVIPSGVKSIGDYAFSYCTSLTSVIIPNSVSTIGEKAFIICSGLTSVTIPNSVTTIGYSAFESCSSLTSVTIPNSVTTIDSRAFAVCSGLTSVTIPNSVTSIRDGAFNGCNKLVNVKINSNSIISKEYSSTFNLSNIFGSQVKSYIIGDDVTAIGNYAFKGCSSLTSVTIGNSVTSIGNYAFSGCNNLTSVTVGNSVKTIGVYAFNGCSKLNSVTLPDNIDNIYSSIFNSTASFRVNNGSKTLFALWNGGYTGIFDKNTDKSLAPPTLTAKSTQTTMKIKVEPLHSGYTYTCNGENIGSNGKTITGLYPEEYKSFTLKVSKDALSYSISKSFRTEGLYPVVSGSVTASSIKATGSYTKGDAVVTKAVIIFDDLKSIKEMEGNSISVCGLRPNKSYDVYYIITVQGNKTYGDGKTFKTSELTMTTEQPKVVSVGNVIVSAKANVDDAETNVGFEWRRTDWTDDFKSNTGTAYMYEGTMEGYIRNLYAEKLWKFRPYYLADDGTYYYGDWMGLDPTNTSYFEPTVHTYANINVEGNTALVKGYALGGTDKITVQGFKYWKAANLAPSGDLALEARKASPAIPADAQTIEAEGRVMEATLSGLDYECTYSYVAFAKTEEGTFYGEVKTFTTGPNTTGIEVVHDADSETKAVDDKVRGIYTLTGVKVSDDAADLKMLKRGIYIVNGRKVAVK